jgi:hypothetical protein
MPSDLVLPLANYGTQKNMWTFLSNIFDHQGNLRITDHPTLDSLQSVGVHWTIHGYGFAIREDSNITTIDAVCKQELHSVPFAQKHRLVMAFRTTSHLLQSSQIQHKSLAHRDHVWGRTRRR